MESQIIQLSTEKKALLDEGIAAMQAENIFGRIMLKDHTVWRENPKEISNRLGWLDSPDTVLSQIDQVTTLVDAVRTAGYKKVLLLGMGGSSLAPEVFSKTFGFAKGYLELEVLDSTHPDRVAHYANKLDPETTLFVVSTKSGGTVETLSFFKYFYNWTVKKLGKEKAGEHFIAITDPSSKLGELAQTYAFRQIFINDPNIGGRYSALSFFGMVPAALMGVDIARLLKNAKAALTSFGPDTPIQENTAAVVGAAMGKFAPQGVDKVTFVLSKEIGSFGDWVEQLIAESTGKDSKGILPVVGEKAGKPEVYGKDRLFAFIQLGKDNKLAKKSQALAEAGFSVINLKIDDLYDLGEQFLLWELATAVSGYFLDIQPFDQPNVESAKVAARSMTATFMETGKLPEGQEVPFNTEAFVNFIDTGNTGDYVSIQAYINPTKKAHKLLAKIQKRVRKQTGLAVTVGFGPRFLHSTGQLHKGDGGNGLFIQILSDPKTHLDIPDNAGEEGSTMSFGVLVRSQALGDAAALRDAGRRMVSLESKDILTDLKLLTKALK